MYFSTFTKRNQVEVWPKFWSSMIDAKSPIMFKDSMLWVCCAFGNIFLTPSLIVPVLVSLCMIQTKYPPSPKSLTAAPDMRHVQSLLLPPAQVFIYTSNSFVAKLLFHANSNMSGRQWQWTPQFRTWLGCLLALDALQFFFIFRWNILNFFSIF